MTGARGAAATPGDILRNLVFYPVFYLGSFGLVLSAAILLLVSERGAVVLGLGWSRWHRFCVTRILGIRLQIEGIKPGPGVLIAIKHESFFEAIDLPVLLGSPVIFAKAELMRLPLWGAVGRRYGLVAVERTAGASALRKMISAARAYAESGRSLAIFPEGTRVPHGQAPKLQSGFAGLYKLLGYPVVPGAVNSGPLYHRRWKRKGTITMRFGETIPAGLARDEIEARVVAAINVLNAPDAADQKSTAIPSLTQSP
jgi:1-acyl-sn-glycerol-3-phosphate acyltransferase